MDDEVKNKLISKFKIFTNLSDNVYKKHHCGFTFGNNEHSLVIEHCCENELKMNHYWGGNSDDLFYHRIHFEDVYYYPFHGFIDITFFGSFRITPPDWMMEYSFKNENLKLNWDEFFKKLDFFLVQLI